MTSPTPTPGAARWASLPSHRRWLAGQADSLLGFFEKASINRAGGFHQLDTAGHPYPAGEPTGG